MSWEGPRTSPKVTDLAAALKDIESRYRDLVEDNLAGFYRTTAAGAFLEINSAFAKLFGYEREELLALRAQDLYFETQHRDEVLTRLRAQGQLQSGEVLMRARDGTPVWVVFSERMYRGADGAEVIEGTLIDISARRRAESALKESQHRMSQALRAARAGAWEWEMATGKVSWSDENFEVLGYAPREVEPTYKAWLARLHPDDAAAAERGVNQAVQGHSDLDIEFRVVWPDGSIHWIRDVGRLVLDAASQPAGMYGIQLDVTERRRAEDEQRRAQKLESVGVLAGGLAHDFNNLLTSILASVTMAREGGTDAERSELLADAERAAMRARDLTRQLLTFARGGAPVRQALRLERALREVASFALAGTNVVARLDIADGLWPVEADEGQLVQALNNLLLNAAQAMPQGGQVAVRASNLAPPTPEGLPLVVIAIEDRGTGIAPEHLSKVFDPYFTTKRQGSGLGLSVVHSIVKGHGGRVLVESAPGHGATFTVELPASPGLVVPAAPDPDRAVPAPAPARILMMDDEPFIRRAAARALSRHGCEVTGAADGAEAVSLYEAELRAGRPFDAVILDLTVPGGMGGEQALARMLELDPGVKAVVSSGYAAGGALANYRALGFSAAVEKPWRPEDLVGAIRRLVGR